MTCLGAFACKRVPFATLADFTIGECCKRVTNFRRAAVISHPTFEALAHARAPVASAVPVAGSFHVTRLDTLSGIGIDLAWLACLACEAGKTFLAVAGSHIIVGTHACIHHAKVVILSCFDVLPYPRTTV